MLCKALPSILLIAWSSAALALPGSGERFSFSRLDTNGDGRISRAEAATDKWLRQGFDSADLNGDGMLDRAEFAREIASVAIRPTPRG